MARLTGAVLSDDQLFRARVGELLKSGAVPVSLTQDQSITAAAALDVALVDGRANLDVAIATIEKMRASQTPVAIFMIAADANPAAILQAMRAGANEFFAWPLENDPFQ